MDEDETEHRSSERPFGVFRAHTPPDATRKPDQPEPQPGFVTLHQRNMALNPIILCYRHARAPSSSPLPQRGGHGTTPAVL